VRHDAQVATAAHDDGDEGNFGHQASCEGLENCH
jgi:hypothetical protein